MTLNPYLIVKNYERSISFYSAFCQSEPLSYAPGRFASFLFENTRLSLFNPNYDEELIASGKDLSEHFSEEYILANRNQIVYGNNIVLNISVQDLKKQYSRLKELGIGRLSDIMYINIAAPYYCFWLTDPDGNIIELTGPYIPS